MFDILTRLEIITIFSTHQIRFTTLSNDSKDKDEDSDESAQTSSSEEENYDYSGSEYDDDVPTSIDFGDDFPTAPALDSIDGSSQPITVENQPDDKSNSNSINNDNNSNGNDNNPVEKKRGKGSRRRKPAKKRPSHFYPQPITGSTETKEKQ